MREVIHTLTMNDSTSNMIAMYHFRCRNSSMAVLVACTFSKSTQCPPGTVTILESPHQAFRKPSCCTAHSSSTTNYSGCSILHPSNPFSSSKNKSKICREVMITSAYNFACGSLISCSFRSGSDAALLWKAQLQAEGQTRGL